MLWRLIGGVGCLGLTFLLGWLAGLRMAAMQEFKSKLRSAGLTKSLAKVLFEMPPLLKSLIALTMLNGEIGETRLSDKDRERVNDVLTRYEKEITNK